MPQSVRGLSEDDKMLVLLSDGSAHFIPDVDYRLARYSLEQLGVPTTVLRVTYTRRPEILCQLDEVGHWYHLVKGSRVRQCNFSQVLMKAIQNGDGSPLLMKKPHPTFNKIRKIFNKYETLTVYN